MESYEGMKTLECLRGRLVAERQASRMAKEAEEFMTKKLTELQNKLKEEIKLKNKAEKKLKFLKMKLESLKLSSFVPIESEQSCSSEDNDIKPTVKDSEFTQKTSQNQVANSTSSERSQESDPFSEEHSTARCVSPTSSSASSLDFPSPEYQFHKPQDSKRDGDNMYAIPSRAPLHQLLTQLLKNYETDSEERNASMILTFVLFRQLGRQTVYPPGWRQNFNSRDFAELYNLGSPVAAVYFNCQRESGSGRRRRS